MDTRGRSPLDKRRRFTKGGALMPTIEPIYLVDPPEQPQQQQPQSRIQRQDASELLPFGGLHARLIARVVLRVLSGRKVIT